MSLDTTNLIPLAAVTASGSPPFAASTLSLSGSTVSTAVAKGSFYKASAGSTLLVIISYQGYFTGTAGRTSLYARIDSTDHLITGRHSNTASRRFCIAGMKEVTGISEGWHTMDLWFSHPGFLSTTLFFGNITLNDFLSLSVLEVDA